MEKLTSTSDWKDSKITIYESKIYIWVSTRIYSEIYEWRLAIIHEWSMKKLKDVRKKLEKENW